MSAGRPQLLVNENTYAKIEYLAQCGLKQENIAVSLGWSPRTWYRKKAKDERILAAYQRGIATAAMLVGESLLKQCIAGNITAIKWWERTRLGYSEKPAKQDPNRSWEGVGLSALLSDDEEDDF